MRKNVQIQRKKLGKSGGRARVFEEAIEWLVSAGMINRVYNVSKPEHPIAAFDILNAFKLYFFDTGLLKCMAGIHNQAILLKSDYQFKGALAENFVLQQLVSKYDIYPRYYSTKHGEIDFILQNEQTIIPVEVKGGTSKKATSFKKYIAEKSPNVAIRFSEMGYTKDGNITNIPLYMAGLTKKLTSSEIKD